MRLWFSLTALLILACIVFEASAAKSNRDTADSTKDNYKSRNSKEVRYAKNKNANYKKKENGREQEVMKERKQREKREENPNTDDANKMLKKNENERGGKVTYKDQKKQKPNEQQKFDKSQTYVKGDRNKFKEPKDSVKKHKRSLEIEQPTQESLTPDASSEDSIINSVPRKEISKYKINKKTGHIAEPNRDAIANNDQVAEEKSSGGTDSSINENDSGWKKKKIVKDQQGNFKKIKRQVYVDSVELSKKNGSPRKRDSIEEKVQKLQRSINMDAGNDEDLILTTENSYYLNEDGVIKEKKSESMNVKKYKSSKMSSGTASECKCRENGCKIAASNTQRHRKQKLEEYQSDVCNLEVEDSVKEDKIQNEKSENSVDDTMKSGTVDLEREEDEDEGTRNTDVKSAGYNEVQDGTVEGEHCVREE